MTRTLTTEELQTRGAEMVPGLFEFAEGYAKLIDRTLRREAVSGDRSSELLLEALFFCLHVIDRLAFRFLGPEQRDVFDNSLLFSLASRLTRAGVDVDPIRQAYNERHGEYANYNRIIAGGGESQRGTLCWEFAHRLALDAGITNPVTIDLLAIGAANCVTALADLLKDPEMGVVSI